MNNSENTIDGEVSGSSSQSKDTVELGTNTTGVMELHKQALQQVMKRNANQQIAQVAQDNKEALQQLRCLMRLPQSPEQRQQIIELLKSNSQLMAAFIKQRQILQQTAQQSGNSDVSDEEYLTLGINNINLTNDEL